MEPINQIILAKFLKLAGDRLDGDWVIIGGSVLPLLGIDHRVTLDIDIASCNQETSQRSIIELMELALEIGLPVEGINQAAAFFLEKIPNWRQNLVLMRSGQCSRFFRPNLDLFLRLKMPRLSESDLKDCLEILRIKPEECNDHVTRSLIAEIKSLSKSCHEPGKKERYLVLEKALKKIPSRGRSK